MSDLSRYKGDALFLGVAALIIVLDQLTKALVRAKLEHLTVQVIGSFLEFRFVKNTGAGFGLAQGYNTFLIVASILIVIFFLYYYWQVRGRKLPSMLTAVIVGGAAGNLIDRLFFGFVTDFIDFSFWPTFNLADIAITVGIIGLIIFVSKTRTS